LINVNGEAWSIYPASPMYTGTSGKVIDQETGKPISDARVVL